MAVMGVEVRAWGDGEVRVVHEYRFVMKLSPRSHVTSMDTTINSSHTHSSLIYTCTHTHTHTHTHTQLLDEMSPLKHEFIRFNCFNNSLFL